MMDAGRALERLAIGRRARIGPEFAGPTVSRPIRVRRAPALPMCAARTSRRRARSSRVSSVRTCGGRVSSVLILSGLASSGPRRGQVRNVRRSSGPRSARAFSSQAAARPDVQAVRVLRRVDRVAAAPVRRPVPAGRVLRRVPVGVRAVALPALIPAAVAPASAPDPAVAVAARPAVVAVAAVAVVEVAAVTSRTDARVRVGARPVSLQRCL